METFAVGDIVLIFFPYADFSKFKKRPALIVGKAEFDNFILCQITSKPNASKRAIPIKDNDLGTGGLNVKSYIRPDKIFTTEKSTIDKRLGSLKIEKIDEVQEKLRALFS